MSGYVPNIPSKVREAERKDARSPDPRREYFDTYEQHTAHLSERPVRTQVILRIGVFFDGTGNNASNTLLGQQCGAQGEVVDDAFSAFCKPYMADAEGSYGNDVTNVYKLWNLYPNTLKLTTEGRDRPVAHRRVYVDGIGTTAGQEDLLLGMGLGRGASGVEARVREAFGYIGFAMAEFIKANPAVEVGGLCFDVFGFSRGAAAARHFANSLGLDFNGSLAGVVKTYQSAFASWFVPRLGGDVSVPFIGLFDTVAAVAGWSDFGSVKDASNPGIELYLDPTKFPRVVQLVARDEHRANFALNSVGPDHTELVLPGVHSDIGGGYLPSSDESVLIGRMRSVAGAPGFHIALTDAYRQVVAQREAWLARGWPAHELQLIVSDRIRQAVPPRKGLSQTPKERAFVGLRLQRSVRGELSRVYLQLMHRLASECGVSFDELDDRDDALAIPQELQPLCRRFLAGDYRTTADEEQLLMRRYIHTSAHWNPQPALDYYGRTRLFYVHAPTENGQRVVHPHQARRAWL